MLRTFTFILLSSIVLFSCNKDKKATKQIDKYVIEGTWRITNFNDSGSNETSDFSGYTFTFSDNGNVIASNGSNTISGTWNTNTNSSDDSSSDVHFNLSFSVSDQSIFEDLNDDWDVNDHSKTKLDLKDVSGGNGGTDLLVFEKN